MNSLVLRSLGLVAVIAVAGCAPGSPVILKDGATDGSLLPVRDSGIKEAWVKPDVNFSSYRQILLLPTEMQFRPVRPGAGNGLARSRDHEFPVSPADRQRLLDTVNEVAREELATSRRLTLTDTPGPDVLLVRISLLDVISRVPPEGPGRTDVYLDEIGAATLVLEVQDGTSGGMLARAVERRIADPVDGLDGPGRLSRVTSVTVWSEVRRSARRFATAAALWIDQLQPREGTTG